MMLCIDSGNTRIKWALHDGAGWQGSGAVAQGDFAALAADLLPLTVDACIAANVAGASADQAIEHLLQQKGSAVHWVRSSDRAGGVINGYLHPERLGVDRWCALIGAHALHRGPALVVMAGTATTVDTLDAAGYFLGGLILPGVALMRRALARDTAALPLADGTHRDFPARTEDAIFTGCLEAQAGAIERAFAKAPAGSVCLLSGGAAPMLKSLLNMPLRTVDNLVLEGLLALSAAGHQLES